MIGRDRKALRKKAGNHMLVPLLGESFNIAMRQPHKAERIFPYNSRSVTAGFQGDVINLVLKICSITI